MGKSEKKIKKIIIPITKRQTCLIREYVEKNGYYANMGKDFWLISQPVVRAFEQRMDILLLTKTQGEKLKRILKKMGLLKKATQ